MAKKGKDISLDELEEELSEVELEEESESDEEIEEIEEFSLDEISEEEEISKIFEEEIEVIEEEEVPKEEIIDERIYIVPLAIARRGPRNKRAKKAIRYLREYITRHFKPESLVISQEVNEKIWERSIQKPPRKLKVRVTKNIDGLCVIYLA
ncbi:MAG: 60S ribosomal protein L31 [Candidatus Lokiarchaeota archaeon]|nr:60S ribosomal protein L31 [Candidatus Lokiarchaeota archaeon]